MTAKGPTMFIIAGSNGAGKSTYYTTVENNIVEKSINLRLLNSIRLNADEILRQNGGDWRKSSDNLKAMSKEVKLINSCIQNKEDFNFETTLAANKKTYLKYIQKAKQNNFEVVLIYVGLNSAELAITRVKSRVKKGGHGVNKDLVIKRYDKSLLNLKELISYFDEVKLFDNSEIFTNIYHRHHQIIEINKNNYNWAKEAIENDLAKVHGK